MEIGNGLRFWNVFFCLLSVTSFEFRIGIGFGIVIRIRMDWEKTGSSDLHYYKWTSITGYVTSLFFGRGFHCQFHLIRGSFVTELQYVFRLVLEAKMEELLDLPFG